MVLDHSSCGCGTVAVGKFAIEYWDWFAVGLFILITVDMITTMYAAVAIGPAGEANPLMRWALGQGMLVVTAVNLAATIISVGGFYGLIQLLDRTSAPYDWYFGLGIQLWLGFLVSAGLAVFANNLVVIVFGQTLLFG